MHEDVRGGRAVPAADGRERHGKGAAGIRTRMSEAGERCPRPMDARDTCGFPTRVVCWATGRGGHRRGLVAQVSSHVWNSYILGGSWWVTRLRYSGTGSRAAAARPCAACEIKKNAVNT